MQWPQKTVVNRVRARLYFGLRLFLHKKRWLLRFTQVLRALFVIGPLRTSLIRFHQRFNDNHPLKTDKTSWLPHLDVDQTVSNIEACGYALGGILPEECVTKILQFCKSHPEADYWNPHQDCDVIDRLSRNEKILAIARKYLGAEPILWLSELKWTLAGKNDESRTVRLSCQEPILYDVHSFHYDAIDCRSLTVFVYLTDVRPDSGPHVVIENTHNGKTFKELTRIVISDAEAQKKYGDRIKTFLGPKGFVIFEETTSYHKVAACQANRLVLKLDYVLQRQRTPEKPKVAPIADELVVPLATPTR